MRQADYSRLSSNRRPWEQVPGIQFDVVKSFIAQILATSKFPAMQRNDGRGRDEIRPINFELNVAPHASGWCWSQWDKHV